MADENQWSNRLESGLVRSALGTRALSKRGANKSAGVHHATTWEITTQINLLGYSIEQDIFSQSECDHLLEALSSSLGKPSRAGARHLMNHPAIGAIAFDQRLLDIAQHSLDGAAIPYRATVFEKSIHAKWFVVWHQDRTLPMETGFESPEWGPWSRKAGINYAHAPAWALSRIIALRIHLDRSSRDNGPLKVIPGSHRAGVMSQEEVLNYAGARQPVECLVDCGGVLAMSPLLIHSSSKARSNMPRRVLHIEYTRALQLSPTIRLAVA